jgi:hypothetical protein
LSHYTPFYDVLVRAVRESQKQETKKIKMKKAVKRFISHIRGEATAHTIATKIGLFRGLGNVLNPTSFCVDRFSRFGVTSGQSWGFPIGNKNGPYYTG